MKATHQFIDEILRASHRKRTFTLPVTRGEFGETKPCRYKPGHTFTATAQPTSQRPRRTITLTVTTVTRHDQNWHITFLAGEHDTTDKPIYLARGGGFTHSPYRQAIPGDPEYSPPTKHDRERAHENAKQHRLSPQQTALRKVKRELETCADVLSDMRARRRIQLAVKAVTKAEQHLTRQENLSPTDETCYDTQSLSADGTTHTE